MMDQVAVVGVEARQRVHFQEVRNAALGHGSRCATRPGQPSSWNTVRADVSTVCSTSGGNCAGQRYVTSRR